MWRFIVDSLAYTPWAGIETEDLLTGNYEAEGGDYFVIDELGTRRSLRRLGYYLIRKCNQQGYCNYPLPSNAKFPDAPATPSNRRSGAPTTPPTATAPAPPAPEGSRANPIMLSFN